MTTTRAALPFRLATSKAKRLKPPKTVYAPIDEAKRAWQHGLFSGVAMGCCIGAGFVVIVMQSAGRIH